MHLTWQKAFHVTFDVTHTHTHTRTSHSFFRNGNFFFIKFKFSFPWAKEKWDEFWYACLPLLCVYIAKLHVNDSDGFVFCHCRRDAIILCHSVWQCESFDVLRMTGAHHHHHRSQHHSFFCFQVSIHHPHHPYTATGIFAFYFVEFFFLLIGYGFHNLSTTWLWRVFHFIWK